MAVTILGATLTAKIVRLAPASVARRLTQAWWRRQYEDCRQSLRLAILPPRLPLARRIGDCHKS
jgi:hypothetical protein